MYTNSLYEVVRSYIDTGTSLRSIARELHNDLKWDLEHTEKVLEGLANEGLIAITNRPDDRWGSCWIVDREWMPSTAEEIDRFNDEHLCNSNNG